MKNALTILFMFPVLWISLAAQAQETAPIVTEGEVRSVCQQAIEDVRRDIAVRAEANHSCEQANEGEWAHIRSSCYALERMNIATINRIYDLLDPGNTRTFTSAAEAEEAISHCRPVTVSHCAPDAPPPSSVPPSATGPSHTDTPHPSRVHYHLHMTCEHGRITGSGWNQVCICPDTSTIIVGDRIVSSRVRAHHESESVPRPVEGDTYLFYTCGDPDNDAVPPEAEHEGDDWRSWTLRIIRLEQQACDAPTAHPGFQALCIRVHNLENEIGPLDHSRIDVLEEEYNHLMSNQRATCVGDTMTDEAWLALTNERRNELCEQFHRDALVDRVGGDGGFNHARFLASAGFDFGYDGAANTAPIYGDMRAQFEFAITETAWFYARAEGGWGTLNDSPNWIGTVPIAESAFWGVGAGASFDLLPFLTLSVGASYHGLLNYGPTRRDELIGEYRGHRVTADLGLRLVANPRDTVRFFGELDLSGGWTEVFGEHNGAAVPLNSGTILGSLRIGLMF